jgi:hypothetical protein
MIPGQRRRSRFVAICPANQRQTRQRYNSLELISLSFTHDSFDCISEQAGHYIELKCRHTHYPTLLIEEMKYRKLITQAAERDLIPFYINSTPLGVFSFDLMDLAEPEWVSHWMPATTEFSRSNKVSKLVGYLPIEEGVQL